MNSTGPTTTRKPEQMVAQPIGSPDAIKDAITARSEDRRPPEDRVTDRPKVTEAE